MKGEHFLLLCCSPLVAKCLPAILERLQTHLRLSSARRSALENQLRLYVFEREAKELQTWLSIKKTAAESKDCGQDLEDVEVSENNIREDHRRSLKTEDVTT